MWRELAGQLRGGGGGGAATGTGRHGCPVERLNQHGWPRAHRGSAVRGWTGQHNSTNAPHAFFPLRRRPTRRCAVGRGRIRFRRGRGGGKREIEGEKGRERSVLVWAHKEGEESKAGQLWTDPNYFFPRPRHYGYWQEARRRLDGSNAAEHAPDECAHSARAAYATDGQYDR